MAWTTPVTTATAASGFDYVAYNKIGANLLVLSGADASIVNSTDAATGHALALRDADGDIAFRDVVARDIAASGSVYLSGVTAGEYLIPGCIDNSEHASSLVANYTKHAEIKNPHSGTIRVRFALKSLSGTGTVYGRIYRNGIAAGIEHILTDDEYTLYTEDIAVTFNDLVQIYAKGYYPSIALFSLSYNGPGVYALTLP
jgi:hypothetical protein